MRLRFCIRRGPRLRLRRRRSDAPSARLLSLLLRRLLTPALLLTLLLHATRLLLLALLLPLLLLLPLQSSSASRCLIARRAQGGHRSHGVLGGRAAARSRRWLLLRFGLRPGLLRLLVSALLGLVSLTLECAELFHQIGGHGRVRLRPECWLP